MVAGLAVTDALHAQTPPILKQYTANLTWTANTEDDLAGYRVYRGTTKAVCDDLATPLPPLLATPDTQVVIGVAANPSYVDTTIPKVDGSVCYEITAFDVAQNESGRSNRAVGSINANPPSAPRNLNLGVVIK